VQQLALLLSTEGNFTPVAAKTSYIDAGSSCFLHSICRASCYDGKSIWTGLVAVHNEDMLRLIYVSLSKRMLRQYLETGHADLHPNYILTSAIGTASFQFGDLQIGYPD
jgi:hypothetical protein